MEFGKMTLAQATHRARAEAHDTHRVMHVTCRIVGGDAETGFDTAYAIIAEVTLRALEKAGETLPRYALDAAECRARIVQTYHPTEGFTRRTA